MQTLQADQVITLIESSKEIDEVIFLLDNYVKSNFGKDGVEINLGRSYYIKFNDNDRSVAVYRSYNGGGMLGSIESFSTEFDEETQKLTDLMKKALVKIEKIRDNAEKEEYSRLNERSSESHRVLY